MVRVAILLSSVTSVILLVAHIAGSYRIATKTSRRTSRGAVEKDHQRALPTIKLATVYGLADKDKRANLLYMTWYRGNYSVMEFPFPCWAAGRADIRAYIFLKTIQDGARFLPDRVDGLDALLRAFSSEYSDVMGVISSPRKVMEWNGARMDFDERRHKDVFWPSASGTVLMAHLAEKHGLMKSDGATKVRSVMEVGVGSGWACMYFNAKHPEMKVTYTDIWRNAIAHAMTLPEVQKGGRVREELLPDDIQNIWNVVGSTDRQSLVRNEQPSTKLVDEVPIEVLNPSMRLDNNKADFFLGNMMYWKRGVPGWKTFDLVMSNPPYIPKKEDRLDGERKNEQLWCSGTELIKQLVDNTEDYVSDGGNLILYFSSVSWLDAQVVEAIERASDTPVSGKAVSLIYGEEHPFDVPEFDQVEFLLGLDEGEMKTGNETKYYYKHRQLKLSAGPVQVYTTISEIPVDNDQRQVFENFEAELPESMQDLPLDTFAKAERSLYGDSGDSESSLWGTAPIFEKSVNKIKASKHQNSRRFWNYIYILKIQRVKTHSVNNARAASDVSPNILNERYTGSFDENSSKSNIPGLMVVGTKYPTAPQVNDNKRVDDIRSQGFTIIHKKLMDASMKADPDKKFDMLGTRIKLYKSNRPDSFQWFYYFLDPAKVQPDDVLCGYSRDAWTNNRANHGCGVLTVDFTEDQELRKLEKSITFEHGKPPIGLLLDYIAPWRMKIKDTDSLEEKQEKVSKYFSNLRDYYNSDLNPMVKPLDPIVFNTAEALLLDNLEHPKKLEKMVYWGPVNRAHEESSSFWCSDLSDAQGPFAKNHIGEYLWAQDQCSNPMLERPQREDKNMSETWPRALYGGYFSKPTCGTSFCAWKGTELSKLLDLNALLYESGTRIETFHLAQGMFDKKRKGQKWWPQESLYNEIVVPFAKYTNAIQGILVPATTFHLSVENFPDEEIAKDALAWTRGLHLNRPPTTEDFLPQRKRVLQTVLAARKAVAQDLLNVAESQVPVYVIDLDHEGNFPVRYISEDEQALLDEAGADTSTIEDLANGAAVAVEQPQEVVEPDSEEEPGHAGRWLPTEAVA